MLSVSVHLISLVLVENFFSLYDIPSSVIIGSKLSCSLSVFR